MSLSNYSILYFKGSSGQPKCVVHTHFGIANELLCQVPKGLGVSVLSVYTEVNSLSAMGEYKDTPPSSCSGYA